MEQKRITLQPSSGAEAVYCPYYIRDAGAVIVCEGLTFGRDSVQRFRRAADREEWVRAVCASAACGRLCPQAAVLNMLYDEDAPKPERVLRVFEEDEKRRHNGNRTRRRRRAARRRPRQKECFPKDA